MQHSQDDKEVYCSTHVPKIGPGKFDGESIGIKSALNAPKSGTIINEQIRLNFMCQTVINYKYQIYLRFIKQACYV